MVMNAAGIADIRLRMLRILGSLGSLDLAFFKASVHSDKSFSARVVAIAEE